MLYTYYNLRQKSYPNLQIFGSKQNNLHSYLETSAFNQSRLEINSNKAGFQSACIHMKIFHSTRFCFLNNKYQSLHFVLEKSECIHSRVHASQFPYEYQNQDLEAKLEILGYLFIICTIKPLRFSSSSDRYPDIHLQKIITQFFKLLFH